MVPLVSRHGRLVKVFAIYLGVFTLNLIIPLTSTASHTQRMWLWTSMIVSALSLYVLLKEGLPDKKTLWYGLILAILAGLVTPRIGLVTFFSFISASRIFELRPQQRIEVLKRPYLASIGLGLGVGLALGFFNLFLSSGQSFQFQLSFYAFLVSLNPGIHEEIAYRFFLYSFSIYLLGGEINSRKERVWVYVLMILPHVLLHFPDQLFMNGIFTLDLGNLVGGILILSTLFGLPFALLMIKRDLTSSMLAHTVVDFIRFIFYGLPF